MNRSTLLDRLPRSPALIALLGCLVMLPTVGAGWVMDDVLFRARLLGAETALGAAPWWDLYVFGRPEANEALRAAGLHPWWADPTMKMSFYRPLSAATHVLDSLLWPDHPALHHLHNVLWYGAAVAAAFGALRVLHPDTPRLPPLAALIFAVAAPHATAVGWVAGRNTLISFALSCGLLTLHIEGRRRGRRSMQLAAVALLALGLLSGEATLGGLAWVIAWQLTLDPAPWPKRLAALLPYGVVFLAWRLAYVDAGFGAQATGIYHDPGSDLLGALQAIVTNLPVLTFSRWLLVPMDAWALFTAPIKAGLIAMSLLILPLLGTLLAPLLRAHPRARFWALASLLSTLPFTVTMPMDRLTLFAGLGSSALLALLALNPQLSGLGAKAVGALLLLHLPASALLALIRGGTVGLGVGLFTAGLEQAPSDDAVPEQTFVYVTGTFHRVHYTTLMRQIEGDAPAPRRSVVLSSCLSDTRVTRVDHDSLLIEVDAGFMRYDLDTIHRRDPRALTVGETVELPDLSVEVLDLTEDGRPLKVAFHFKQPLEHPSLRWLWLDPGDSLSFPPAARTAPFALPAIGETVTLSGVMPSAFE